MAYPLSQRRAARTRHEVSFRRGLRAALGWREGVSRRTIELRDGDAISRSTNPVPPRTPSAKVVVPAVPPSALRRQRLETVLDEALSRRLTVAVAGAGFGKSTLLAAWAERADCAWYSATEEDAALPLLARGIAHALRLRLPGLPVEISAAVDGMHGPEAGEDGLLRARELAGLLCDFLAAKLRRDLVLVVDDVHELGPPGAAGGLIESLVREAPARFHLVLASRTELPFPIERLRSQGQVLEVSSVELAFTGSEIAALLRVELGDDAAGLAEALHEATDGWPAAVRLASEALGRVTAGERPDVLSRLPHPGGALYAYLATEVFAREPPEIRELICKVAPLDGFTPELLVTLGVDGAAELLASLSKRGLFLELRRSETGWFSLSPLVRDFVVTHRPLPTAELVDLHRGAAAWFESHGYLQEALRSLAASGDHVEVTRVLAEHGRQLLRAGATHTVLRAAEPLPHADRNASVD